MVIVSTEGLQTSRPSRFFEGGDITYYQKPKIWKPVFGKIITCDNPLYDCCTVFEEGDKGIAVVQQRWVSKMTFWDHIDPWLANDIYTNPKFPEFFKTFAGEKDIHGFYPTIYVRQIMHALGMHPLRKEFWETRF